ncbi:glycosyl transferase family 1 [Aureimonas sp. SA4125]|uniref:glycosyltransferase family 4 protein n=1 Tax=Aureimonas sp. SA4125 TaxID=2826993 RepID=UPI001CC63BB8|nr:glycosyltransferase family 4 protein [Aureimonas sp. SA4125]BDA85290.1 glycosyl transferase family 1 [Aureimonas sp. SA4125]
MPSAPARGKLVFVVTEDWFFVSHFLPMVRAAREIGLAVVVVTRVRAHADLIEAAGARVVPLEAERRSVNPLAISATVGRLAQILREERPDIVHCIALKSILVGGMAARRTGIDRRIYALTGLGFIGAKRDLVGRLARAGLRLALRGALQTAQTRYLFENVDDPLLLGLDPAGERVTIVGGAGIDPDRLTPSPLPGLPPLRVAVVARMLWSKGIDVAVEATRLARLAGADVTLSLFGAPDPSNPRAIPAETLEAWSRQDGVTWHGRADDIATVWRDHHVACLPSRGGEGLPRTLLESAACGRAMVTTDVPGCRSFVREGRDGLIVPPGDAAALAAAFARLAGDPGEVADMGRSARARALSGYTERHVMDAVAALYESMLNRRATDTTAPAARRLEP